MSAFDIDAFLDPKSFPDQLPMGADRANEYAALSVAGTRRVLGQVPPPERLHYGEDGQQVFDIYRPAGSEGQVLPAVIFLHGGGWTAGYPYWSGFMAPGAHAFGAAFLAPSYRLAPRRKFPSHLEDVLSMLAWVRANAQRLGIDPDRIVLGGHSAGGHLTALTTLRMDLFPKFGLPARPFRMAFVVSGSMTLRFAVRPPGSVEQRVYEHFFEKEEDDLVASPLSYVAAGSAPFHIMVGENDPDRIKNSTQELADKLTAVGTEVSRRVLPGHDHFDTHLNLADPQHFWWKDVAAALK